MAATTGRAISFRYNYRINGHQEALTIGAYGIGGIPLAEACEKQLAAKKSHPLQKEELGLFYKCLEKVGTTPSIRAACKLLLLTLQGKGELTNAMQTDVSFTEGTLTIPAAE